MVTPAGPLTLVTNFKVLPVAPHVKAEGVPMEGCAQERARAAGLPLHAFGAALCGVPLRPVLLRELSRL